MKDHYGLSKFKSTPQRKRVLANLDLLRYVTDRNGKVSLKKERVKELRQTHKYFDDHYSMSNLESMQSSIERLLNLVDDDGFIHPRFHQLQAKTGRITTTRPSPFDKSMRPIVVPSHEGFGIFEMDVGQAEVWLIACMSGDEGLQRACESYDVYLRLGIEIVSGQFSAEDAELIRRGANSATEESLLKDFKENKYRTLRNYLLKPLVLAILYGQTPRTVAKKTGQKRSYIDDIFRRLRESYPSLFQFIDRNIKYGSTRGYIELRGGFRIHVAGSENEINRLRNNPIQGMCAILFNQALLQAYQAAARHNAAILFPLYDAIVCEAPLGSFEACITTMLEIFSNVFQSAFPDAITNVKLDVNQVDPSCWNDDGASDSLDNVPFRRVKNKT